MHRIRALRSIIGRIAGSDPTDEKIRSALTRIEKEASSILAIAASPDPMLSSVAHDLLVNAEKARLRDLIAKSRGELTNAVGGFRTAQEAARSVKANLVPDQYAVETRQIYRSLDTVAKHKFMGEAIKAGDSATIAALLDVPLILSGLTAEQADRYRESFLDTVAGPSSKNVADQLQDVVDTALGAAESIAQPTDGAAVRAA